MKKVINSDILRYDRFLLKVKALCKTEFPFLSTLICSCNKTIWFMCSKWVWRHFQQWTEKKSNKNRKNVVISNSNSEIFAITSTNNRTKPKSEKKNFKWWQNKRTCYFMWYYFRNFCFNRQNKKFADKNCLVTSIQFIIESQLHDLFAFYCNLQSLQIHSILVLYECDCDLFIFHWRFYCFNCLYYPNAFHIVSFINV